MAGVNNAVCTPSPIEPDAAGFAGARSIVVVRSEVYTKKTDLTTQETRLTSGQFRFTTNWQLVR